MAGRARCTSAQDVVVEGEELFNAIGEVTAGERGAADVGDIGADFELVGNGFTDKLIAPFQLADLKAVSFTIFDDLELPQRAVRVDADGIGHVFVLADHLIEDEPAEKFPRRLRLPDFEMHASNIDTGLLREALDFFGCERHRRRDKFLRLHKNQRARLFHTHVLGGEAGYCGDGNNGLRREPANVHGHGEILAELLTQYDVVKSKQPLHAFGDMARGKCRAADVLNIDREFEGIGERFADELLAPLGAFYLVAIVLAIVDDLNLPHGAVEADTHAVDHEFFFTQHLVDDEPADGFSIDLCEPHPLVWGTDLHAGLLFNARNLLRCHGHRRGDKFFRVGKYQCLRLRKTHVRNGDTVCANHCNDCGRREPTDVKRHNS